MNSTEESNFQLFRDCLSTPLISKSTIKSPVKKRKARAGRKTAIKPVSNIEEPNDAEELADFIDYIALETFTSLPQDLRNLTYTTWLNDQCLQNAYCTSLPKPLGQKLLLPLSPEITESLTTYTFLPPDSTHQDLIDFLFPTLESYVSTVLTAPPAPELLRGKVAECEICARDWIPLSYHHLIPRGVHEKVLKRGWHTEDQLMNAAWLCRACHSFVHHVATNEELAKDYYTVERLLEREDVRKYGEWVGKVRWKAR